MSFICPYPLAYGIETSAKTVWVLEERNCALRCPTVTYTHNEWSQLGRRAELLFVISLAGTCCIFFYQLYHSKLKAEFIPRIMFLLGFFLISLFMVIFLFSNGVSKHDLTCDEHSAFVEREPLCVFQAWSTIFFIIWIEMWSFFMAFENYLFICSALEQSSNHGKNNYKYILISLFVCGTCATIPLAAGNLGFDYQANLPICLFLVSDNRNYLWGTLVAPFGFFAVLCLVYTLKSIHKIQSIFVSNEKYQVNAKSESNSRNTSGTDPKSDHSSSIRMTGVGPTVATPMHTYGDDRLTEANRHQEPIYDDYVEPDLTRKPPYLLVLWEKVKRTWKYNGRQMIFFATFCWCTIAIIPVVVYAYGTQFDHFVDGTEDFLECLIYAAAGYQAENPGTSTQDAVDEYAESECGARPSTRPSTSLILTLICWFAAYGVIPVFIYGFASDRFQSFISRLQSRLNCDSCRNSKCLRSMSISHGSSLTAPPLPPVRSGIDSEFH